MRARRSHTGISRPTITSWSHQRAMRSKALLWSARTRAEQSASWDSRRCARSVLTWGAASPIT
eukprot:9301624-Alexandrium_andersonii.AAC.1